MAQSIVDTWMEEWLQQGIQQGIQQEKEHFIRRLLERGNFSHEEIAALVGVDIAWVRKSVTRSEKGS